MGGCLLYCCWKAAAPLELHRCLMSHACLAMLGSLTLNDDNDVREYEDQKTHKYF